jgi:hypothetical protein
MLLESILMASLVLIRILRDYRGEERSKAEAFRRACRTD